MYFERLLAGNVRYLGNDAHDFAIGPGRLRRWNLFPAGVLPRRSCAPWHWRVWAGGNWRGSRSDLRWIWPSGPISRCISSSSNFCTRPRSADPPARCADIWAGGLARKASSAPCPSPPCSTAIPPRGRVVRIWAGPMSAGCSWAMAAKSGHKLARIASTSIPTSDSSDARVCSTRRHRSPIRWRSWSDCATSQNIGLGAPAHSWPD